MQPHVSLSMHPGPCPALGLQSECRVHLSQLQILRCLSSFMPSLTLIPALHCHSSLPACVQHGNQRILHWGSNLWQGHVKSRHADIIFLGIAQSYARTGTLINESLHATYRAEGIAASCTDVLLAIFISLHALLCCKSSSCRCCRGACHS